MTEAYENVLRKSLDIADRRQKLGKASKLSLILGIAFLFVGEVIIVPAMMNLRAIDKGYSIYVVTVVAGALFIAGLALVVIAVSHRNTLLILRAIQLASETPETAVAASVGLSGKRDA
ncbi:MAG: hypothetical protein ABSF28_03115 [Terracidiphilus sp.]|jgi:hypothetical protein